MTRGSYMSRGPRSAGGFTLIELMIALVLGLLVIAGAIGIFMANRRAYASTETLGRMQETARVAFELMARDVREAGANPCGSKIPVANTLNTTSDWYMSTIASGMIGHDGAVSTGATAKLSYSYGSSDAIDIVA